MSNEKIIVGGNVSGNISSCKYEVSDFITGKPNVFLRTRASVAVNNCSGDVIKNDYWEIEPDSIMGACFIIMLSIFMALVIKSLSLPR